MGQNEHIMLVKEQTHYNLERLPLTMENLQIDLDRIKTYDNLDDDIKYYELKKDGYASIPLHKLPHDDDYTLLPSPVYKNRYYLVEEFGELYKKDLIEVIKNLAYGMGAQLVEVELLNQEEYNQRSDDRSDNLQVDADPKSKLSSKLSISKNKNHQHSSNYRKTQNRFASSAKADEGNTITKPKNKKELGEYIGQCHINIECLPQNFKIAVNTFLETGEIQGTLRQEALKQEHSITKNVKDSFKLSVKIMNAINAAPIQIGKETTHKDTMEEHKYYEYILYKMHFPKKNSLLDLLKYYFSKLFLRGNI